jgi:hypothetical protein
VSLLSDVHKWLSTSYATAEDAYQDIRDFVPGTMLINGVPTPIKSSIDLLFGTDWERAQTIEAYGVLFGGARQTASSEADAITRSVSPLIGGTAMPALIIPGAYQVTISMVSGGHAVENVIGVVNGGGTAAGAAAAVLAAWKVATGPLSRLSSLVAMTGVRAVDISSGSGAIVTVNDTTAGSIGSTNSLATRGACALVQFNGGTRSRSSRGRLYYGPIMESDINVDGATVGGATVANLATAMTAFRNSLNSSGYPLNVLSRKLSQAFPVTSQSIETTIATQRRRIR